MVKTQDEPTVGHLGSAKNVQDPSTGCTRAPYRKHSTTLQYTLDPPTGLAEPLGRKSMPYPRRSRCSAMLINKAQGQSLIVAGLYYEPHCFAHGQFYVCCSRVGCRNNLFIYAPGGETRNVVYREVL